MLTFQNLNDSFEHASTNLEKLAPATENLYKEEGSQLPEALLESLDTEITALFTDLSQMLKTQEYHARANEIKCFLKIIPILKTAHYAYYWRAYHSLFDALDLLLQQWLQDLKTKQNIDYDDVVVWSELRNYAGDDDDLDIVKSIDATIIAGLKKMNGGRA